MRRPKHTNGAGRAAQRGVGLIEVLIALLVLSFGMLGLAGLQMWSLRYNQSAMERGMAVVQTHSIVDAMRADRAAALAGDFNHDFGVTAPAGATFPEVSLRTWLQSVEEALGEGATGRVFCDGAACTISVRWDDSRASPPDEEDGEEDGEEEAAPRTQTVTTEVQL